MEGGGFEPPKLSWQIYSLLPLATREPLHYCTTFFAAPQKVDAIIGGEKSNAIANKGFFLNLSSSCLISSNSQAHSTEPWLFYQQFVFLIY